MGAVSVVTSNWLGAQAWVLRRMDTLGYRRRASHLEVGLRGEREALLALRRRGYVIVAQRWRCDTLPGDIDLIAWDGKWLCFIEVKTRRGRDPLSPAEIKVDEPKRFILRRMARSYLKRFPERSRRSIPVRFDVVSVYLQASGAEIEVLKGSFGWSQDRDTGSRGSGV